MILDLVEVDVKPKRSKFKIIMGILIVLLVLSIPTMFIIKFYFMDNAKPDNNVNENIVENNIEIIDVNNENNSEQDNTPKLELTSVGIENIKNLYDSEEKRVFLTFDDGPSKTVTPRILETLKNENVKASFFVLGNRVELYPELVKQEYDEGHYIANHGNSHVYESIYSSVQAVLDEYNETQDKIRDALEMPEYNSYIFRFPGGSNGGKYANLKNQAKEYLEENNIAYIDWNCLNSDATGRDLTEDDMLEEVINTSTDKNTVVVLMHDAGDKEKTANALPMIIEYFRNEGYTFENFYSIIE